MPRTNHNTSIKCISLDVDKTAYEYLIGRGYSLKELFSKMMYSLMDIERDSDIRYENSRKAFSEMIKKDMEEKEAAAADARRAAELAAREKENKLSKILPVFKLFVKKSERYMDFDDEQLFRVYQRWFIDTIRKYPEYENNVFVNRKWITAIRKYYSQNEKYNPDLITPDITDILL